MYGRGARVSPLPSATLSAAVSPAVAATCVIVVPLLPLCAAATLLAVPPVWFPAARRIKRRVAGGRAKQAAGRRQNVVGSPRQQWQAGPEID
jgi:hypothetical protein